MSREEAIAYMGTRYVFHAAYKSQENHSAYVEVDVKLTFFRVRDRLRQERSLSAAVADVKQRLHAVHGTRAA
jgi:hypothetical protein